MREYFKIFNLDGVKSELSRNWVKYGIIVVIVVIILNFFWYILNINLWNFEVGFIDPSTAFAESLIKLYNFIWSFLMLVIGVVLVLMIRIMYLFSWKNSIKTINFINKIIYFYYYIFLNISLVLNEVKYIERYIDRLNSLFNEEKNLNLWYSDFNNKEFLLISDLSEYKKLEFIWCVLPACVLAIIAGPSFSLVFSLDSSVNPEINIKVVGKQWYWTYSFENFLELEYEFIKKNDINNNYINDKLLSSFMDLTYYKDYNELTNYSLNYYTLKQNINFKFDSVMVSEEDLIKGTHRLLEVDNRLVVPTGVPIRFLITSIDVLHSWSLPSLGLKVDAVPGRLNQFIVEIKKPGVYYGQCSELCGPMHGFMPIVIKAVNLTEYKIWLKNIFNIDNNVYENYIKFLKKNNIN